MASSKTSNKGRRPTIEFRTVQSKYPAEAFEFLRQGLDYTVDRIHGPSGRIVRSLLDWLGRQNATIKDLPKLAAGGALPAALAKSLAGLGDLDLDDWIASQHVSGEELCLGLRDLALAKWGPMALAVLHHWGIRSTRDFGEMVFTLIDQGILQKQPQDSLSDFDNVYDFREQFDGPYEIEIADADSADDQDD